MNLFRRFVRNVGLYLARRNEPAPSAHHDRDRRSGCDCGGGLSLRDGDRFIYAIDGRRGVAGELLQDGDCGVDFDDGMSGTIKWNWMYPDTPEGRDAARRRRVTSGMA